MLPLAAAYHQGVYKGPKTLGFRPLDILYNFRDMVDYVIRSEIHTDCIAASIML